MVAQPPEAAADEVPVPLIDGDIRRGAQALRRRQLEEGRDAEIARDAHGALNGVKEPIPLRHGRVEGQEAHPLAGDGEGLAEGVAVEGVRIQRGQEGDLRPAVDQLPVGLVRQKVDGPAQLPLPAGEHGGELLQVLPGVDRAAGVIGGVQDDEGGPLRHRRLQGGKVQLEALRQARNGLHRRPHGLRIDPVLREGGGGDDDLLPRGKQDPAEERQGGGGPVREADVLRPVGHGEAAVQVVRDLRPDGGDAGGGDIGVALRRGDGIHQAAHGGVEGSGGIGAGGADGEVKDVLRPHLPGPPGAVGAELPDDGAASAPAQGSF